MFVSTELRPNYWHTFVYTELCPLVGICLYVQNSVHLLYCTSIRVWCTY